MQKVGIIGGIGPESTIDYYKNIISGYRKETGDSNYPEISITSINMTEMLSYVARQDYSKLINLLLLSISQLKNAGAEFAVIASNTPHIVFDSLKDKSPLPLISIVEETCKRAYSLALKKVLLIGTAFTMKSDFYPKGFSKYNITTVVPDEKEQKMINDIIFPELEEGIVIPAKKKQLMQICNGIIAKENIDGIVLGCTELPLMLKDNDFKIKILNTAQIHIDSIVTRLKG
jgi:aspartate racemase